MRDRRREWTARAIIASRSSSITDCIRYGMRAGRKELTADNERIFVSIRSILDIVNSRTRHWPDR